MSEYPFDQVSWIVGKLATRPTDLAQFAAEIDEWIKLERAGHSGIQGGLTELLEDWMTSLRLQADADWRRQMGEPTGQRRAHAETPQPSGPGRFLSLNPEGGWCL